MSFFIKLFLQDVQLFKKPLKVHYIMAITGSIGECIKVKIFINR